MIAGPAALAATHTAVVAVHVEVRAHLSLRVSSWVLEFDIPQGLQDRSPQAVIEYRATARVAHDRRVVLTVNETGPLQGPSGRADVDASVAFSGEGDGTMRGVLSTIGAEIAAQWSGPGAREGRLTFMLSGPLAPGKYLLPINLALITP